MLRIFPDPSPMSPSSDGQTPPWVWLDLESPTPEENAQAEALIGTTIPTLADLTEIEASSRLRHRDGALTLATPSAAPQPAEEGASAVGFVLSQGRLATVRFTPSPAFDAIAAGIEAGSMVPANGVDVFTHINEELVDRIADGLERLAAELGTVSASAFQRED